MIKSKHTDVSLVSLAFFNCNRCHPSVLTFLIQHGAALDEKDKKDYTPLRLATIAGCKKSINILIDKGCDVNSQVTSSYLKLPSSSFHPSDSVIAATTTHPKNG